jgi:hypothetical protein
MFERIEKLRKKSDAEKIRYIFGISIGVTAVVALFWGVATTFKVNNGSFSFTVESSEGDGMQGFGKKVGDSWGVFFPDVEPTIVATSTPDEASSTSPYRDLEVMLGQPEVADDGGEDPSADIGE